MEAVKAGDALENGGAPLLVSAVPPSVRVGFLRRVYGLLFAQLVATAGVCAATVAAPEGMSWVRRPEAILGAGLATVPLACAVGCVRQRHPWNLVLLAAFTACEAIVVAHVCALYATTGLGALVLTAVVLTAIVFGSISAYVWLSGRDFSFVGGFLYTASLSVLAIVTFGLFVPTGPLQIGVAIGSVMLFAGFVLYDTSQMLHRYGPDDAVDAALALYLDVIGLFLNFLQLLRGCDGHD